MSRWPKLGVGALVAGLVLAGCSGPPADGKVHILAPPRDTFQPVSDTLSAHCGSLDCHGNWQRNFRVYGVYGLRIGTTSDDVAGTNDDEREATYESIVMLEPEIISQVVHEGGAHPERLTVVRKGRGAEHHKGGTQMPFNSAGDVCLSTWFGPNLNTDACAAALPDGWPPPTLP